MDASAPEIFELGLLLALAALAGWGARRLGLPAVIGYLAVGLLVSPFTPGYAVDRAQLQTLADVGVVLLLFEVGIEIDPLRIRHNGALLWAAPLQVLVTLGAGVGVAQLAGLDHRGGLLLGLCVALSSSVVVVNMTRSRRRTLNPATSRALLTWSVLQDLTAVVIAMGVLASVQSGSQPLALTLGGIVLFIVIAIAFAWLLPRVLRHLRVQHDLFLVLSVGSGLLLAGLGARYFALPVALAAFIGGLAIGESPVAAEVRERLAPLRDVFAVLFFVSIGTLIDPPAIAPALPWLGVVLGLILVAKLLPIFGLARLTRPPEVRALQLAVGLAQVGEFSFVLATVGVVRHVIPAELYTALLAGVVLTIAVSTIAVRLVPTSQTQHAR
ncbi:MAG TPA: cation:proton antiporter [Candidatus Dormibacteraeota bacterium]|nr:cation:proton antiporter [Candidatus Dormibacteraeota bacterium]